MVTQEPINTQDFMASFKGFMDKAVAQASDEEPVFLRSLRAHLEKNRKICLRSNQNRMRFIPGWQ